MEHSARAAVQRLAGTLAQRRGNLVIDADCHVTDTARYPPRSESGYYHGRPISAEDLITEMDMAGVDMANIWQNPAATNYPGGEDENADSLLAANRYVFDSGARFPDRFITSGWTDPRACGVSHACRIAEICVREFGFVVVKMNPAQNRFPIDSPEVRVVLERIIELGAIPAFHYGADSPFTPAQGLENLMLDFPDQPFIAVHMGGGGAGYVEAENLYHASRELGFRRPNLRYILSAKRDTHIEEALISYQMRGAPFTHNLFCASDAPYGRMTWNFGGFRTMFQSLLNGSQHTDSRLRTEPKLFTPEAVDGYMGRNFADLILAGCDRLIRANSAAAV
jgi:predicted TIM-barrel fold metal-dependent hydrolase